MRLAENATERGFHESSAERSAAPEPDDS
jgi:hypothetical protein